MRRFVARSSFVHLRLQRCSRTFLERLKMAKLLAPRKSKKGRESFFGDFACAGEVHCLLSPQEYVLRSAVRPLGDSETHRPVEQSVLLH